MWFDNFENFDQLFISIVAFSQKCFYFHFKLVGGFVWWIFYYYYSQESNAMNLLQMWTYTKETVIYL